MKSKFFSENFIDELPDDHLMALMAICQEARKLGTEAELKIEYLEDYLEALAIYQAYANSKKFKIAPPVPGNNPHESINNIRSFFAATEAELTRLLNTIYLDRQTQKYADRFATDSVYVFTDDDFGQIQALINEMRDLITNNKVITPKHKQRLLERLERMQRELHKTTSDLDRFWGFIGEAGIVIRKFGDDLKPLVDRIRELSEIVWKTVSIREKLLQQSNPIVIPESNSEGNKTLSA